MQTPVFLMVVMLPPGDAIFYIGNNISLATTQIFLKATILQQNQTVLTWNLPHPTTHAQKFVLMKSHNQKEWTEIYQTEYLFNTLTYEYKDEQLHKPTHYQVILIDNQGNFYYSNIASVAMDETNIFIAPNPFYDQLLIQASEELQTIKIYDIQGNLIQNLEIIPLKQTTIPTENYPQGMYIIEIYTQNHHFLKKIIKK